MSSSQKSGPRRVLVLAVVSLGALLVVGVIPKLNQRAELKAAQRVSELPRLVTVAPAKVAESAGELVLPGTAAALETATLYARTNGFVRDIKVDIGDRVEAGAVLAVLETPEMEADASSARARAAENERNAELARSTAERHARLAQAGVSSQQQVDEAEARANSASAASATSRSDVDRWNTLLAFRNVRAPFAGVVTRRNVDKGDLVTSGSSSGVTPMFEIARIESLRVVVDVPQQLAQDVRVGGEAEVRQGTVKVLGKVTRTAGALDQSTRTLRTEVQIPGDQGILAGSFVRVALRTQSAKPPVQVPANSLVARSGGNRVFVIDAANTVHDVSIVLGRELGAQVEIVSGLEGSERVVTNPAENLADGEVVRIAEPKRAAK